MSRFIVSEQRVVPAEPARVFDLLADPAMHPVMDGSGTVRAARPGNPDRLTLGARFSMDMKLGASYKILNTVVEFEEGRLIAWRHFNGHVWRYRLEPVEGGTRVTEEWDARPTRDRVLLVLMGYPGRNRKGIRRTLDRLAELVGRRT